MSVRTKIKADPGGLEMPDQKKIKSEPEELEMLEEQKIKSEPEEHGLPQQDATLAELQAEAKQLEAEVKVLEEKKEELEKSCCENLPDPETRKKMLLMLRSIDHYDDLFKMRGRITQLENTMKSHKRAFEIMKGNREKLAKWLGDGKEGKDLWKAYQQAFKEVDELKKKRAAESGL